MNPPQVYMCSPSWTLLPPPSPFHPSGSSQCTSPKHPVSCIEPGLAIHFIHDILHVSMPFSQIFPPSPSLTESIRLFYTSVSLLKSMTNLDNILKSRHYLQTKVCLVKAMDFPVVIYGCESWTIKKTEHQRMMLLNCDVAEDSWESLGLQGDPTSQS